MVMSLEVAEYYATVCIAFKSVGEEGFSSLEAVQQEYVGLTQNTACNWAVYGWPVQNELTVENHMLRIAQYIEELKAQNILLRNIIDGRQAVMDTQLNKINQLTMNE